MKKKSAIITLIVSIIAAIAIIVTCVACKGDPGQQGPQGTQGEKGEDGVGIVSIEKTASDGLIDTYTITFSDGKVTTIEVTNGSQGIQGIQGNPGENGYSPLITIGENGNWFIDGVDTTKPSNVKGDNGNGISKIEKTETNGLVDIYIITFTNGNTTSFEVTNGSQGIQGIQGNPGEDGHSPVITIGSNGNWYIDGVDTTKPSNVKGDSGNGISKIEKTGTNGLVDTYTITFTNGNSTTFEVENGSNGKTAYEIYLEYHPDYTGTEEEWINTFIVQEKYTVTFDSDGGTEVSPQVVSKQGGAVKPENPTKDGFLFDGWYVDDIEWNFYLYSINQNLTLKAKWITDSFSVKTVSNVDGGNFTIVDSQYPSSEEVVLHAEAKDGYVFVGWFDSTDKLLSIENTFTYVVPKNDSIVTAKFLPKEYKVTYVVPDNTENENPDTFTEFTTIVLSNPSLIGHQFAGWYTDEGFTNSISEIGEVKEDTTVYGKFIPKTYTLTLKTNLRYKVTFDYNYTDGDIVDTYIYSGQSIEFPDTPKRTGYVFAGWYTDSAGTTFYNPSQTINNNLTLYAKWVAMAESGTQIDAFKYNSAASCLSTSTGITQIYYYFTVYESKSVTLYIKDYGTRGHLSIYDMTSETRILDISQVSSESYASHSISITKGHVYKMRVLGYNSASTDTISVYFSTINKIKSTGLASGTVIASMKYNDLINYVYDLKEGYNFIGFYDENDNYFNSLRYTVDRDLTLTAKFE